jgi:ABC-type iron transport system FetAB permease component
MAGMVLAGSSPIVAAIYQFVVVAVLVATAGTACLLFAYSLCCSCGAMRFRPLIN